MLENGAIKNITESQDGDSIMAIVEAAIALCATERIKELKREMRREMR